MKVASECAARCRTLAACPLGPPGARRARRDGCATAGGARAVSAHRGVQAQHCSSQQGVRLRMRSVQELEALVNERLRVELEQVQDERDRLYERISHCMELKNNMTMLQDQKRRSLKTMVDLGCSFYVQARMCAQPSRATPGLSLDRPP